MSSLLSKKVFSVITLLFFLFPYVPVFAAPPSIISYQGRLTDANGDLLTGSYNFKFSIWNAASGGSKLWPTGAPTSYPVTVREGVFNVNIGDTANGYPDTLDYTFISATIFLKVEVYNSTTLEFEALSPRQQITSSVFAQVAGSVNGSTTPSSFGTTTPFGTSVVSIEATSTQSTGLSIRGIIGQLANLFQIQDSTGANLFMVDNSGNVGVGTSTATRKFNILDSNSYAQLRLSQASNVYGEFKVDNLGDVQLSSTGGNFNMQSENLWVCSSNCDVTGKPGAGNSGNIILENALFFDNNFKFAQTGAAEVTMFASSTSAIVPILIFDDLEL